MSLANPALLLYLIPLFGVIILLYLLRMRRQDLSVPAAFLWPRMTTDVRANTPIQKLRFNWLMVLQLIAVALVIFAVARPQTRQEGLAGTVTVFVVDTSASMSATDVSPSRLEEAISRVERSISTAQLGDRFSLVEAGPMPRVKLALSGDVGKMRAALRGIEATDAKCDVGAALRLAAALVGATESGSIILLSDGSFPEIDNFSQGKASVHFQKIGDSSDNVAITAMGTGDGSLFCGVRNYSAEKKTVTLSLAADGDVFDSRKVTIEAGQTLAHSRAFPANAHVLEANIEPRDALEADNRAYALASQGSSIRVLLVTEGNIFLERALSLDPRVTLDKATTVPASVREGGTGVNPYDVVVFDSIDEVPVKALGVISFGVSNSPLATTSGAAGAPKAIVVDRESKVMEYVDLSSTFIDSAVRISPKPGAKVVAESDKGPLILTSDVGKKRILVGFSILSSDFPLQVGFPIFIANALDFMVRDPQSGQFAIEVGKTISIPAKTSAAGSLQSPSGTTSISSDLGAYVLRDLHQVGKYVFDAGDETTVLYSSLLNEEESNITPSDSLVVNSREVAPAQAPSRIADFWKPILMLCLLVLAGEWWLFAKRS